MRSVQTIAVAALLILSASANAQNGFERMNAGTGDAAFFALAVPVDLGLLFIHPAPHERESDPSGLDLWARDGLDWRNPRTARRTSDWLLRSFMVASVFAPPVGNWESNEAAWNGSLVGFEALAATQPITGLTKHALRRERPDDAGEDTYASFFSGHASTSFAAATILTTYTQEYDWGGSTGRWASPTAAYTTATLTGYLCIAGRRHWLMDVLVGAAVGTGTAWLTYELRTN